MNRGRVLTLAIAAVMGFASLAGLGIWQLQRLTWKRALIERVATRIHAPPASAPGPALWSRVNAAEHEYRRVLLRGHYLHDRETRVQAVTTLGGGFWVMTPFRTVDGYDVLVNRGFVPPPLRYPAARSEGQIKGETTVIGLVRMSEPKGGFLRTNDGDTNRWYSRDVAAMAAARGLAHCAPYFVDAESFEPAGTGAPKGGLTVVSFTDNHLQYALTWFALAAMVPAGALLMLRREPNDSASQP